MNTEARSNHRVSAWARFSSKLDHYLREESLHPLLGTVTAHRIDAGALHLLPRTCSEFDLIMTSPPYGDSRTTVQYGAASGICLDVISRLDGLGEEFVAGGAIDRACLGGSKERVKAPFNLRDYWSGAADREPAMRATAFLQDYMEVLKKCSDSLAPDGLVVAVVGRRSMGGFRLKLDDFTRDVLAGFGLVLQSSLKRHLKQKSLPKMINRFGRAADVQQRRAGATKTMDGEIILTLTKKVQGSQLAA